MRHSCTGCGLCGFACCRTVSTFFRPPCQVFANGTIVPLAGNGTLTGLFLGDGEESRKDSRARSSYPPPPTRRPGDKGKLEPPISGVARWCRRRLHCRCVARSVTSPYICAARASSFASMWSPRMQIRATTPFARRSLMGPSPPSLGSRRLPSEASLATTDPRASLASITPRVSQSTASQEPCVLRLLLVEGTNSKHPTAPLPLPLLLCSFITDRSNHVVRKIVDGIISTYAGVPGSAGRCNYRRCVYLPASFRLVMSTQGIRMKGSQPRRRLSTIRCRPPATVPGVFT